MVMQIRRTLTANNAPSGLAEGQLACELASDPPKLWVGVPVSLDPSGRRLVVPSAGGGVAFGTTPPASPNPGDLWFDPVEGQLYIYFNDGTSSQWVVTINQGGGGGGAGGPQMGVTDGSNAAPGEVGEFMSNSGTSSLYFGAITNGSNVERTIGTLTLSAGDWDVRAQLLISSGEGSGNNASAIIAYIASASVPSPNWWTNNGPQFLFIKENSITATSVTTTSSSYAIAPVRFSLSVTTTLNLYLAFQTLNLTGSGGGGELNNYGTLSARRMR